EFLTCHNRVPIWVDHPGSHPGCRSYRRVSAICEQASDAACRPSGTLVEHIFTGVVHSPLHRVKERSKSVGAMGAVRGSFRLLEARTSSAEPPCLCRFAGVSVVGGRGIEPLTPSMSRAFAISYLLGCSNTCIGAFRLSPDFPQIYGATGD